jgi:hypothetical protein
MRLGHNQRLSLSWVQDSDIRDINMCLLESWVQRIMTLSLNYGERSLILNIIQILLMCSTVEIGIAHLFKRV